MSEIRRIVIHCSATKASMAVDAAWIRRVHMVERGWSDIGYHYVVLRNGHTEQGRYENGDSVLEGKEIGAHVKGKNSDSIAICWAGGFDRDKDAPTPAQYGALVALTKALMKKLCIPSNAVFGHNELEAGKACPNIDMDQFRLLLDAP